MHTNNEQATVATTAMKAKDPSRDDDVGLDVVEVIGEDVLDDDHHPPFWSFSSARDNEGSVRFVHTMGRIEC